MKALSLNILLFFTMLSCHSQKVLPSYTTIELNSRTRGYSEVIQVDLNNISRELSEPGSSSSGERSLTDQEISKINRLVASLDLSGLEELEVPSNQHASDRAQITTLSIQTLGDISYATPMFDRGNPPAEIKEIVELVRELALK